MQETQFSQKENGLICCAVSCKITIKLNAITCGLIKSSKQSVALGITLVCMKTLMQFYTDYSIWIRITEEVISSFRKMVLVFDLFSFCDASMILFCGISVLKTLAIYTCMCNLEVPNRWGHVLEKFLRSIS